MSRPAYAVALNELMQKKRLTNTGLARRCAVSSDAIASIRTGRREPKYTTLRELATGLGMSLVEFMEHIESKESSDG